MTTHTLSGNSTFASLGAANGDTVNCNGFALTIGAQPAQTGIIVNSPGTAGTVVISGAYDLSTWSFTAGTVTLLNSNPSGATIGSITGGSVVNARGCAANAGTILTSTGGSANGTHGTTSNSGGTIYKAVGGSNVTSFGCNTNIGLILSLTDTTAFAVNVWAGSVTFVFGPEVIGRIAAPITKIYSLGIMHPSAILPVGATVITMSVGSGRTWHPLMTPHVIG